MKYREKWNVAMKSGSPRPVWCEALVAGVLVLFVTVGCVCVGIVYMKQQLILREMTELRSFCQQDSSLSDSEVQWPKDSGKFQGNATRVKASG